MLVYHPARMNQGYGLAEGTLTVELNRAGSLNFSIPLGHERYDDFLENEIVDECFVLDGQEEIWRGRIVNIGVNFDGTKHIECEGLLAYLNDSVVKIPEGSYNAKSLLENVYISNHNSLMTKANGSGETIWTHPMSKKKFAVDAVDVDTDFTFQFDENSSYENTLSSIESNLLGVLEGYLKVTRKDGVNHLKYTKEAGETDTSKTQKIRFGKNLLDLTVDFDREELFTVLIPLYSSEDGGTAEMDPITNAEGVKRYGYIYRAETFDEENVQEAASKLLSSAGLISSIEVTAIDMYDIDGSAPKIRLGDSHELYSPPNGLTGKNSYICSEIEYDLLYFENTSFHFGKKQRSMTEQQILQQNRFTEVVRQTKEIANEVNQLVTTNDYITKRGSISNGTDILWTYEQYASGFLRAKYTKMHTGLTPRQQNGKYTATISIAIPFSTNQPWQTPHVNITLDGSAKAENISLTTDTNNRYSIRFNAVADKSFTSVGVVMSFAGDYTYNGE